MRRFWKKFMFFLEKNLYSAFVRFNPMRLNRNLNVKPEQRISTMSEKIISFKTFIFAGIRASQCRTIKL